MDIGQLLIILDLYSPLPGVQTSRLCRLSKISRLPWSVGAARKISADPATAQKIQVIDHDVLNLANLVLFSGYGSVSQSSRDLDRAARKDLNMERRRAKMAEQERSEKEVEKAERLAKQRELAKSLAETLKYRPSA